MAEGGAINTATDLDRVGGQDVAAGDAPSARRARLRIRPVRWHVLWGGFKQAWPLLRFVFVFGGALYFGLHSMATGHLGHHLTKPTAACVSGLMKALGRDLAWATTPDGVAVRLGLGTGSLWVGQACTTAGAWTMWVAFLIALPIGWRARAIVLPAGLAALWILNTVRLSSVLLANSAERYALAKTLHDQAWPWLTALVIAIGAWAFLRWYSGKHGQVTQHQM